MSINVRDFGANGDGIHDDTDAIQKAIDSIVVSSAGPIGSGVTGGEVYLPEGKYLITSPIKLQSAVHLKGAGQGPTILYAPKTDAIHLHTKFGHAYHIAGKIEHLRICTETQGTIGVTVDESVNCISDLRINEVTFCTAGTSIDLYRPYVQQSLFNRITGVTIGGALIRCFGNANEFNALVTEGGNREDFQVEKGVVTLRGGGLSVSNCIIESWKGPIAFYFEDALINYRNNHMEGAIGDHHVAFHFERCSGFIDDLHLLGPRGKAKFINCTDLNIGQINLDGESSERIDQVLDIDTESFLFIDHVRATYDSGFLDHPRVKISSVYSKIGKWQINLPLRVKNLLTGNAFTSPSAWQVIINKPTLKYTVETDNAPGRMGRRLKIVVKENQDNGRLGVIANLGVSADDKGTPGVGKWKIEGCMAEVWHLPSWQQFASRCSDSLTASRSPAPLNPGDQIFWNFFNRPDGSLAVGTYYLSDVEVGPELF